MDSQAVYMSVADVERSNLGKKRKRDMSEWNDRKRKTLKNAGKAYTNRRGVGKDAKSPPKKHKVERRRIRNPDVTESKRKFTFKYHLQQRGERLSVCKPTFMSVYQITNSRIQVIQEKLGSQAKTPASPNQREGQENRAQGQQNPAQVQAGNARSPLEDLRGKHSNRPHRIHPSVKVGIREHILSFPRELSHYTRMKGTVDREYLSADLNVLRMYRLYKEQNPMSPAKFWLYRHIFKQENLRFGQPRSDTCAKCDGYFAKLAAASSVEERKKISDESELHHRKAEKAYTQLEIDKEWAKANTDCHVICVDMQGVVFTPNLTHSNVYYQRQFANYNLCIYGLGTEDRPTMCVWHEGIAHRGSVEVASCLQKWVQSSFTPLVKPKERKLIIYSDRCCGQNNNWRMLNLMSLLISKDFFTEIEQKFMVSGHSFLPCDRSFAIIEKRRKVSKLHTPDDVTEMILQSKAQNPFKVLQMNSEDFRLLPDTVLKKPAGLQITSQMWLKVTAADPWNIHTKQTHSLYEAWKSWLITKPRKGQPPPAPSFSRVYPRAYESPLPVKKEKHKDLMTMLPYLPPAAQAFYQALECGQ